MSLGEVLVVAGMGGAITGAVIAGLFCALIATGGSP